MELPAHLTQHERAEELPLLTDSATVTTVESMDHNRTERVFERVGELLRKHGSGDWAERVESDRAHRIDWNALNSLLDDSVEHGDLRGKLATLRERYERAYPGLLRARFAVEDDFDFAPGQYATVRFEDTPRPYSIASSPNETEIEVAIKRVPGGRLTSKLFQDLDEGDEVTLRGPNGDFVLQEPSSRDLAFLATGTGVAPLRSMIRYTFEEGRDEYDATERDVWLFLGASWEDDLPYREDFRELDADHDNFHFVPTCTREPLLSDWDGETDYVQQVLLRYLTDDAADDVTGQARKYASFDPKNDADARIDPANLEVYACGISAMVSRLVATARQLGVPEEYVEHEGYG